jgi:hypothetical protein
MDGWLDGWMLQGRGGAEPAVAWGGGRWGMGDEGWGMRDGRDVRVGCARLSTRLRGVAGAPTCLSVHGGPRMGRGRWALGRRDGM